MVKEAAEVTMDRRQRKLERQRKKRAVAKKKARIAEANRPSHEELVFAAAARSPIDKCFISRDWDDEAIELPVIVTVVVARRLPDGRFVASTALVDRTCLGVKNADTMGPLSDGELEDLVEDVGTPYDGMLECEPLVALSIVHNALDYARDLGFRPHRDFREPLFGPRPEALLETAWHARPRPLYVTGPRDNVPAILTTLIEAVGAGNFDVIDMAGGDDDEDWELAEDDGDEPPPALTEK